jgi:dienelactone hydrolase
VATVNGDSRDRIRTLLGVGDLASVRPASSRLGETVSVPAPGVVACRLELVAPDGHVVPSLLLAPPPGRETGAAVVAVHQHNGEYALGKSEPAGMVGNPDMAYALELALMGVLCVVPDLAGFEDRSATAGDPQQAESLSAWRLAAAGSTLQGLHTEDVALAVSWIEDNAAPDGRIGVVGHSLGGQVAFFSMACDPRIVAGVISCGVGTVASFIDHGLTHNPAWFVPGLIPAGDSAAVARVAEGQRVRILAGLADPLFPTEGVRAVASAFPAGAAELVEFDGGHEFPGPMRAEALRWLATELSAQGR